MNLLGRLGSSAAAVPVTMNRALDFTGHCAVAFAQAITSPRSVDWGSLLGRMMLRAC
jgi:hypothetical protein